MTDDRTHELDTSVPHPARRYNYWLGGKDNFAADRESAEQILKIYPHARTAAAENRYFLQRVVRYLAADAGVRQFLDIGTGLPTAANTHEVAQTITPAARIVYVDNDPLVLAHARALLTSSPQGRTAYLHQDLRNPQAILADPQLRETLDLTEPVGLLLIAVLHFLPDTGHARAAVKTLVEALPAGSYLAISHATYDTVDPDTAAKAQRQLAGEPFATRTQTEVTGFFGGLELIEPGVVMVSDWRRDPTDPPPAAEQVSIYGALGRKP
jgi:hypothetical protein